MAIIKVTHDDIDCASILGPRPQPTGRLRLWKGLGQEPVLQVEWKPEHTPMTIWVNVPVHEEIEE